jgi:hypothetical protein
MIAEYELNDSFNGWYALAIVGVFVVISLGPYVAWIIKMLLL